MKIGVMALQGAFIEHRRVLELLGAEAVEVRLPAQLAGLDGIIIPGGESTTMSRLMAAYALLDPLAGLAREGLPVMGTCAGMILLAKSVPGFVLPTLGLMDITVRRNAFGSQLDSFEADLDLPVLGPPPFHAVFIRAPVIEEAGMGVEVLAPLSGASRRMAGLTPDAASGAVLPGGATSGAVLPGGATSGAVLPGGAAVAARQGRLLAVAFHPELTSDSRVHRYFLGLARS